MLEAKWEGSRAIIDLRERILNGEHPRNEVFEYVKQAPVGTVFEIHVPRKARPLTSGLEQLGMNVTLTELGEGHYRINTVKLTEL